MKSREIPHYFISKKNIIRQILFTALFAFVFINLYRPFGADEMYDVRWWVFLLVSGLLVTVGMFVIILSRLIMLKVKQTKNITILGYVFMIVAEIMFMAASYTLLERVVVGNIRPFALLYIVSVQNSALILLIPYTVSLLYFSWKEKKVSLEDLLNQIRNKPVVIPFKDENNVLRFTLKANDMLFFAASDNYVEVHYKTIKGTKKHLLRNTLKRIEEEYKDYPFLRCHRSYMVNLDNVKMFNRERGQIVLWMDDEGDIKIPVSRSYAKQVIEIFEKQA